MRWDWMRVTLQADQRQKRNHRNEILPAHPQEPSLVNTTPKMPWEYSENICEKWLRVKSWMNWYSITTRRIRTTMWKSKIVQVHWERASWACSLVPCTFHHTHIGSSSSLVRTFTHDHLHGHPRERFLFDLISSFYLFAFLLSVFLFPFFHLSDEQQPRALTTSSTSPQVMSPTAMTSTSSRTRRSPSPSRSLPRTRTWMTWHSARCSLKHTEDKSITSYKKACQSVSCRRL